MFSAVNLIGRSTTPVKCLITPMWVLRGVRFSNPTVASSHRHYAQQSSYKKSEALVEAKSSRGSEVSTATTFETVKENTRTAGNLAVILLGVGIAGSILWTVLRELFSGNSPYNIYSDALSKCTADTRVQDHLGEPIKAYGEENRRGRRKHLSHSVYEVNGRKHMILKFYIAGTRKKGTVFVEMRADDGGKLQRTLLAMELDDLLRTKIIIEDNRQENAPQNDELPTLFS